jgi:hypothetical protein
MSWKFYNTTDIKEQYLYKFLPFNRLVDFLKEGTIWFSRSDVFGDKMECVLINDLIAGKPDYKKIEERKRKYLISCWHLADNESLSLWDTYADTNEKRRTVAIRFKRLELIKHIKDYEHGAGNGVFHYETEWIQGRVQYKNMITADFKTLSKSLVKHPAFRKEKAFEYENEYRFVVKLNKPTTKEGFEYYLGPKSRLDFEILINPLLNKEQYAQIKKDICDVGFSDKIVPSELTRWLNPEQW